MEQAIWFYVQNLPYLTLMGLFLNALAIFILAGILGHMLRDTLEKEYFEELCKEDNSSKRANEEFADDQAWDTTFALQIAGMAPAVAMPFVILLLNHYMNYCADQFLAQIWALL